MADVATSPFQDWTFEKPSLATDSTHCRTDSSPSSPKLCDVTHALRVNTAVMANANADCREKSICLQERYMSSEEGLSPADLASDSESEYDSDDDVIVHDMAKECQKARTLSVSRWNKGQSCDRAVLVSYAFAGRPKVIELATGPSPVPACPTVQQRSVSVAHLPITATNKLRKADHAQRMSLSVNTTLRPFSPPIRHSVSPSMSLDSRRPSTSHSPITKKLSTLDMSSSVSTTSTIQTGSSSRSSTPVNDTLIRPASAADRPGRPVRSSTYAPSVSRQVTPPTPMSPASHAFLNTDPFGNTTTNVVNSTVKPAPHRRLRSISMKLALARIAITPSSKKNNTLSNGQAPLTPASPFVPPTPQTAPLEGMSSYFTNTAPNKVRRASTIMRPKSRHAESVRGPSPELPSIPDSDAGSSAHRQSKMVARGANEREPMLMLPSFNGMQEPMSSIKSKRLKKRKSLMSLM